MTQQNDPSIPVLRTRAETQELGQSIPTLTQRVDDSPGEAAALAGLPEPLRRALAVELDALQRRLAADMATQLQQRLQVELPALLARVLAQAAPR